ncbi:MAG: exodeoxyribonuclease VII large subunit [Prevotella sp.]|nr:exodeoxyribonuclease VII large subunit [Prevotella sp.]MBR6493817.1 exodeoxyribonuclease VII large subunit [Prevotella sp.]
MTLYELNLLVRDAIEMSLDEEYWVEAEISEVREVRGHCYMELVQKDAFGSTPVARASAKCWKTTWERLRPRFEHTTGQPLHAGMKVMLRVTANFHEAFGFSWIVGDIDPTYTIGDMARKRLEIVAKLKEAGVFDLQKELSLPLFAQRIAVISSEHAAGYGDFCNQLLDNDFGFSFQVKLFPATMQGEAVEGSVIAALDSINSEMENFDCVVIIRGGGATADLSGFDTLALAENVENFPLPIITGIGHERDESVLDMVSFLRVKTPTAAAAFLIDHLAETAQIIDNCQTTIANYSEKRIAAEKLRLTTLSEKIPMLFSLVKTRQTTDFDRLFTRLTTLVEKLLTAERHRLELIRRQAENLDPTVPLRRGYSMTLFNGKIVRDPKSLQSGDEIETKLEKGTLKSIVK